MILINLARQADIINNYTMLTPSLLALLHLPLHQAPPQSGWINCPAPILIQGWLIVHQLELLALKTVPIRKMLSFFVLEVCMHDIKFRVNGVGATLCRCWSIIAGNFGEVFMVLSVQIKTSPILTVRAISPIWVSACRSYIHALALIL